MGKLILVAFILIPFGIGALGQTDCVESAKVVAPTLSDENQIDFAAKLIVAKTLLDASNIKTDGIIWVGRRTAYLGNYKEAITIFSDGIENYPKDPRFYRHRGHRYISIRCFDDAIRDFKKAAKLIKGKPDVVEPDGLPNARNIPTSTLQSNIWYHLGLAYYLKGDFKNAAKAYKKGLLVSKNPDMLVAMTNWRYISVRRWRNQTEANKALEPVKDDLDIIENEEGLK